VTAVAWTLVAVAGFLAGTAALGALVGRCIRVAEHAESGCSDEELEAMVDAACVRHPAGRRRWTAYDDRMLERELRLHMQRGESND
jgi:hypothetical protein